MSITPETIAWIGLGIIGIPMTMFGLAAIVSSYMMITDNENTDSTQDTDINHNKVLPIIKQVEPSLMKIEAIIPCVGYSELLAWTLPVNKHFFDKLVVVTTPQDSKTQTLCKYWEVECRIVNSNQFNKGAFINEGLKSLAGDDWVLCLDADIVLPPKFSEIVRSIELDKNSLYGIDALSVNDLQKWVDFWMNPKLLHECNTYLHLTIFPIADRLVKSDYGGWLPSGYFLMWNQAQKRALFPTDNDSSVTFARSFRTVDRRMLSELACLHLDFTKNISRDRIMWNNKDSLFAHVNYVTPPSGVIISAANPPSGCRNDK